MATKQITSDNSLTKQVKYNLNQLIKSNTFEAELVEFPKVILELIRGAFNVGETDLITTGLQIDSWDASSINTRKGFFVYQDTIYYIEPLTFTPDVSAVWGFLELELIEETGDQELLSIFDSTAKTTNSNLQDTRKIYRVEVYENYSGSASYPVLTPGRVRWINYQKSGPNIVLAESVLTHRDIFVLKASGETKEYEKIENYHIKDDQIDDAKISQANKIGYTANLRTRILTALGGGVKYIVNALNQVDSWLETLEGSFSGHVTTYNNFVATKGQGSGLASLDASGKLVQNVDYSKIENAPAQFSILQTIIPVSGTSGTYSWDDTGKILIAAYLTRSDNSIITLSEFLQAVLYGFWYNTSTKEFSFSQVASCSQILVYYV